MGCAKMTELERVIVTCTVNDKFPREAEYLFRSLQHFGGNLARAQQVAYFVDGADPAQAEVMADLGVAVRISDPVSREFPSTHKIRNLQGHEDEDYDYLLSLDADIIFAGDPSDHIGRDAIAARPAGVNPLADGDWSELFGFFELEMPAKQYVAVQEVNSLVNIVPYFNSGVLLVPKKLVTVLYDEWLAFVPEILAAYDELPEISKHSFFTDQFALSLAIAKAKLPHRALPLEMNFQTNQPFHPSLSPEETEPFIVHYHHRLTPNGGLMHCSYQKANRVIDKVNECLLETEDSKRPGSTRFHNESFDNLRFWENRYATNPLLGSGLGSRGKNLDYQKLVLSKILSKYKPSSILDVGCGDLEVVKNLDYRGRYTGVDISPTIIKRDSKCKPDWVFIPGDFLEIRSQKALNAELVICLDVLIHEHSYEKYREFLQALIETSGKLCLVSGYETAPSFRNDIVAFHEPLTRTLTKLGVRNIQLIGSYRDVCVALMLRD
jgi:SAM-dependent methyltransferase